MNLSTYLLFSIAYAYVLGMALDIWKKRRWSSEFSRETVNSNIVLIFVINAVLVAFKDVLSFSNYTFSLLQYILMIVATILFIKSHIKNEKLLIYIFLVSFVLHTALFGVVL